MTARRGDRQDLVTVGAVNFAPVYGNAKATVEKMTANVEEAAAQGADLVVFPEGALVGCQSCGACRELSAPCDACLQLAETVPGPASEAMARLARERDLYVVFGLPERDRLRDLRHGRCEVEIGRSIEYRIAAQDDERLYRARVHGGDE